MSEPGKRDLGCLWDLIGCLLELAGCLFTLAFVILCTAGIGVTGVRIVTWLGR